MPSPSQLLKGGTIDLFPSLRLMVPDGVSCQLHCMVESFPMVSCHWGVARAQFLLIVFNSNGSQGVARHVRGIRRPLGSLGNGG